jgi:thymidylate synthase (FAD)
MNKILLDALNVITKAGNPLVLEFWGGEVAEITIIDYPSNALTTLARATRGYTGNYSNDPISPEEIERFVNDIKNTKLATPVEFLNFVFLVRDVPRSWTHQAVRTRIGAAYVQESTRFLDARPSYKILVPKTLHDSEGVNHEYKVGIMEAMLSYVNLLEAKKVSSQDARQLLPHGVLTHMFWSINMKSLQNVYNQRWCCAAESSTWIPVMRQMKKSIIATCGEEIGSLLTAPIDRDQDCGFNSSLDRPCIWKSRKASER